MLTPKVGVITWKGVENNTLGNNYSIWSRDFTRNVLLKQGDSGESDQTFGLMGLQHMPLIATIALITLFNILIHLGFASATSLSSALIPVFISLTLHYI